MRRAQFREFLLKKYRGREARKLSDYAADDAASRCARVERVLGVDLDVALKNPETGLPALLDAVARASGKFRFRGDPRMGVAVLGSALRKYAAFVDGK